MSVAPVTPALTKSATAPAPAPGSIAATAPAASVRCVVCNADLAVLPEAERQIHVNDCVDATERKGKRKAKAVVSDSSDSDFVSPPIARIAVNDKPATIVSVHSDRFECPICVKGLSHLKLEYRLKHLRECCASNNIDRKTLHDMKVFDPLPPPPTATGTAGTGASAGAGVNAPSAFLSSLSAIAGSSSNATAASSSAAPSAKSKRKPKTDTASSAAASGGGKKVTGKKRARPVGTTGGLLKGSIGASASALGSGQPPRKKLRLTNDAPTASNVTSTSGDGVTATATSQPPLSKSFVAPMPPPPAPAPARALVSGATTDSIPELRAQIIAMDERIDALIRKRQKLCIKLHAMASLAAPSELEVQISTASADASKIVSTAAMADVFFPPPPPPPPPSPTVDPPLSADATAQLPRAAVASASSDALPAPTATAASLWSLASSNVDFDFPAATSAVASLRSSADWLHGRAPPERAAFIKPMLARSHNADTVFLTPPTASTSAAASSGVEASSAPPPPLATAPPSPPVPSATAPTIGPAIAGDNTAMPIDDNGDSDELETDLTSFLTQRPRRVSDAPTAAPSPVSAAHDPELSQILSAFCAPVIPPSTTAQLITAPAPAIADSAPATSALSPPPESPALIGSLPITPSPQSATDDASRVRRRRSSGSGGSGRRRKKRAPLIYSISPATSHMALPLPAAAATVASAATDVKAAAPSAAAAPFPATPPKPIRSTVDLISPPPSHAIVSTASKGATSPAVVLVSPDRRLPPAPSVTSSPVVDLSLMASPHRPQSAVPVSAITVPAPEADVQRPRSPSPPLSPFPDALEPIEVPAAFVPPPPPPAPTAGVPPPLDVRPPSAAPTLAQAALSRSLSVRREPPPTAPSVPTTAAPAVESLMSSSVEPNWRSYSIEQLKPLCKRYGLKTGSKIPFSATVHQLSLFWRSMHPPASAGAGTASALTVSVPTQAPAPRSKLQLVKKPKATTFDLALSQPLPPSAIDPNKENRPSAANGGNSLSRAASMGTTLIRTISKPSSTAAVAGPPGPPYDRSVSIDSVSSAVSTTSIDPDHLMTSVNASGGGFDDGDDSLILQYHERMSQSVRHFIRSNGELYVQIICHQNVDIEALYHALQEQNICVTRPWLTQFLDAEGVSFKQPAPANPNDKPISASGYGVGGGGGGRRRS